LPSIENDAEVNLHVPYTRILSHQYRAQVVGVMQADLARRRLNLWRLIRYARRTHGRLGTPARPPAPQSGHDPSGDLATPDERQVDTPARD
jgi:hypothetical protein